MVDIVIPDGAFAEEDEAVLSTWYYEDGAYVPEGATVCDIMVAKVQIELTAPSGGALRIGVAEGETVKAGDVIGALVPS